MNPFLIVGVVVWFLLLVLFYFKDLRAFAFVLGAIGCFIFTMLFFREEVFAAMNWVTMTALNGIGQLTGWFNAYPIADKITVFNGNDALSFVITYECSGVIELAVYISTILFYHVLSLKKKIKYLLLGGLAIIATNIVRLIVIVGAVKLFGTAAFFISHVIVARGLFIVVMLWIYYLTFTRTHTVFKEMEKEAAHNV